MGRPKRGRERKRKGGRRKQAFRKASLPRSTLYPVKYPTYEATPARAGIIPMTTWQTQTPNHAKSPPCLCLFVSDCIVLPPPLPPSLFHTSQLAGMSAVATVTMMRPSISVCMALRLVELSCSYVDTDASSAGRYRSHGREGGREKGRERQTGTQTGRSRHKHRRRECTTSARPAWAAPRSTCVKQCACGWVKFRFSQAMCVCACVGGWSQFVKVKHCTCAGACAVTLCQARAIIGDVPCVRCDRIACARRERCQWFRV